MSSLPRFLPILLISASLFSAERLHPVQVTQFRSFSRGITFDYDGNAFVSHGRFLSRVTVDGKKTYWTETGAPDGHKILPDGTHLVCDGSRHAVLHLDAKGKLLGMASSEGGGKPLIEPKDLTLDPKGGFYFTDSGGTRERRAGEILFVDSLGTTHLAASQLHFPQGIVLRPDGKTLLVAESMRNRILSYEVLSPGRLGPMKVFADLPRMQVGQIANEPQGLCLDQHGNLYVAHYGMGNVEVLSKKGRFIRQYPAGLLTPSSVAFGGPQMDELFIAGAAGAEGRSQSAIFRLTVPGEKGLPLPPPAEKPQVPFVEAGPACLYYREFGEGAPLVFLHGGWGYEVYPFDCALAALAGRFRVLIPDRSGYGRSPKLESLPTDFHRRAGDETLRFLDALGIERAWLWGHSDGAVIAALIGLAAPQRCQGLILEAFHYTRSKRGSVDFFRAMISEPESVGGRAMEALTRDHGCEWQKVLERNAAAWLEIVQSGQGDLYDGHLSQLTVPVLFIDGSRDPRIEPGDPDAIRRQLPHAEFRVIDGAGHSPHSEPGAAGECVRIAAGWLHQNERRI